MLDLLIVLAFVAWSITAGFRARRKASQNLTEYFLAGRTIRGWRAGVSMAATQFAADTPLLVTGLIATAGVFALWRMWIYALAFLLLAFVFSGMWRRARVLTDAEFTELRYSGKGVLTLRVLKALFYGTVFNCIVMAWVLFAAVRVAEIFLPWHLWLPPELYGFLTGLIETSGLQLGRPAEGLSGAETTVNNLISVGLILGFAALYSTTGGLRGVISTDVMQFGIMLLGTAFYAWYVLTHERVRELGGLRDGVVSLYGPEEASRLLSFWPPPGELLLPFLMVVAIQWFVQINSDGTGYLAQRSMACVSDREARIAGVVFTWLQILFRSLLWMVIGVGILIIYPFDLSDAGESGFTAAREILFATGMDDLLPTGIRGLMLTAMLAALASTLDTHLNWGASYWSNDIYKRAICQQWRKREPSDRELVLVARLSNLLLVAIALVVMANLDSIQQAWTISLLFGAAVGPVLVLRWLWERINLHSELTAILLSLLAAPLLLWLGGEIGTEAWRESAAERAVAGGWAAFFSEEWIRLVVMGGLAMASAVAGALLFPRTDPEVLRKFFRKVKPVGWWSETEKTLGITDRRSLDNLKQSLATMGLCSLSLFLLLAGLGRLIVSPPGASLTLTLLFTAGGLLLIPRWWKAAFGPARSR